MRSKALPHLWNYFRKFPLYSVDSSPLFFDKVDRMASFLIETNSNRVALKFLEHYAYCLPDCNPKLKEQVFRKLYMVSRGLGSRKFKMYNLIYRFRAFESNENLQSCYWFI